MPRIAPFLSARLPARLVACLLAIAVADASAQSIWKWRDAAGQLHIGDAPPPADIPAKNILQRPGAGAAQLGPVDAVAAGASTPESDLQKKKARADRDKADKAAADKLAQDTKNAAIRRDSCQRAQTEASAIQSGGRIARMNANGEREFLDDDARAAELKRAQDIASQNCGNATAAP